MYGEEDEEDEGMFDIYCVYQFCFFGCLYEDLLIVKLVKGGSYSDIYDYQFKQYGKVNW